MVFCFGQFLYVFGQLIQAQQALLSDIFESRVDCHRSAAHEMKNMHEVGHMRLSQTPLRLMSVKESGDSFQIIKCHPL